MIKERESSRIIERQGTAIIKMNYRINELQDKVEFYKNKLKNKQSVISELIEENVEMYTDLKQTRIEKEEIEAREIDLARKIKIVEDLINSFDVQLYDQIKNVLANSDQTKANT